MRDVDGDTEWTPSEYARLDSLSRERAPSDLLRARTVAELKRRRLVHDNNTSTFKKATWIAIAASLVFVAGGLVGYRLALTSLETRVRLATAAPGSLASDSLATAGRGHVVWF